MIFHSQWLFFAFFQAHFPDSLDVRIRSGIHEDRVRIGHRNRVGDFQQRFFIGDPVQLRQILLVTPGLEQRLRFIQRVDPTDFSQDVKAFFQFQHA